MKRSMLVGGLIGALLVASAAPALGTDWRQYAFDPHHSGHNAAETILSQSNVGNLLYGFGAQAGLTGEISQAIVVNGVAYVGVGTQGGQGMVYAFYADTGALKWSAGVCGTEGTTMPAFAAGRVWVRSEGGEFTGFDANSGDVFFCDDGPSASAGQAPSSTSGVVYTTDRFGGIWAIDAVTGFSLWKVTIGTQALSTPAVAGGFLYTSSYPSGINQMGFVYKVRASDGTLLWTRPINAWCCSPPAVAGSSVFVGARGVWSLAASTGAVNWHTTTGLGIDTSPAIAGGKLFVGTEGNGQSGGGIASLDAATGAVLWNNGNVGEVFAPLTVANGVLYLIRASQGPLDMFRADTGAFLAERVSPSDPQGVYQTGLGVTVVNGMVYASTANAPILDAWGL